jgi:beta-barrel assembly-enhancing protease
MAGLFYALGRQAAPSILKAKWMLHALTGNKREIVDSEYALGRHLADIYEKDVGLAGLAEADERLGRIGRRLAERVKNKELRFHFKSDAAAEANAIALPGGFIYMSAPLYRLCDCEDELGFVLAHEMAHVVRGHASKRFLGSLAANAVSKAGIRGSPAQRALREMLVKVMVRGYNRGQEFEADDFAASLSRAAGFDPRTGVLVLRKMRAGQADEHGVLNEYFSTHPSAEERVSRIVGKGDRQ